MIYLVGNDTQPLDVTLDVTQDLTGASVSFHMKERSGTKDVTGACTIISASLKQVRFTFSAGNLDTPGLYDAEWQITRAGGIETAPNKLTELIFVRPEVGSAAFSSGLISLQRYQEAVGESDDPAAQIQAILDASAAVLAYTDRDFAAPNVTETRTYQYDGRGILEIDDASAVTGVAGFPALNWRAMTETPPTSPRMYSYILLPKQRQLSGEMGFTANWDTILARGATVPLFDVTVTGTFGWPVVPDDVQRATILAAQDLQNATTKESSGELAAKSVAEVSEQYTIPFAQALPAASTNLPAKATDLLWLYKRHSF